VTPLLNASHFLVRAAVFGFAAPGFPAWFGKKMASFEF
jgi:hypothetical protein